MKRILFIFAVFLISIGTYAANRQYMFYTDANINRLKELVKSNEDTKTAWKAIENQAEKMMQKRDNSVDDIQVLALMYRMTGDEQYAERVKKTLQNAVKKETWEEQGLLQRTPAWNAGLRTAHSTFNVALGLDCIYDYLSSGERKEIADGLEELGIRRIMGDWINPLTNIHTFDTMGHNWWTACVDIAGIASIAIRNENKEAMDWVETVSDASVEWFKYSGSVLQNKIPSIDRNGGLWESINYASFGMSQYLLFRLAQQNALNNAKLPELPEMNRINEFFMQNSYFQDSVTISVNFGDGHFTRNGHPCALLLWNLGYQDDNVAWYLQQTDHEGNREGLTKNTPLGLVLDPGISKSADLKQPDLPTSKLFPDMGWATMRSSWDKNATMLAVKSGLAWNHSHADAGSYILYHNGKNLLIDDGNCSYGNPLYTQYYCQSVAHNVVLWNGKGEEKTSPYFGSVNRGSLHDLLDGNGFKYLLADATGPYSHYLSRNYRSFIWVGDVIVMYDDLKSYEPGKFEWLLHYNGESKRRGKDLSVKDGDAEVLVRPLFPQTFPAGGLPHDFPEQMTLEERMGYEDHHPENRKPYWSISSNATTDRTKYVQAILLKNEGKELPKVERFEGDNYLGVRITQDGKVTEIYFNLLADGRIKHRNSINTMNGWETDAYILAMTFDEGDDVAQTKNIKQLLMAHGSYLRKDETVVVHSLSKFFATIDFETMAVDFEGQDIAKLLVHCNKKTSSVLFNGKKTATTYQSDIKCAEIDVKQADN